jgi:tetratricopeptide (TPR) repeat protein
MFRMSNPPDRPRAARRLLPAALIVGAVLLAYAPVLRAGFIWDDDAFLTANPLIHAADGLYRFWFTTDPPDYFPLTSSMLWFEWRLWGQNAAGYHVINVLLHAAGALLLWRVLLRLRVPGAFGGQAGAWLAGLLFALHPVAVESVAWITERKNVLPMALYLASILAYLRFEDIPARVSSHHDGTTSTTQGTPHSALRTPQYFLSLGLFLLALLAKTSVVMLPPVLLGCAWWRRGRITRRDLLRVLPFAALAAALGLVTIWYQYHGAVAGETVRTDSPAARAAGAGWAAWFYLYKALLPVNLCFVYPRWTTSASLWAFVPGLLFLAMLCLFARFRRSWGRPFLFALGYFLVALLPVLGFLNIYFMRYSLVADHWQYTALIGVVALVAGLLGWAMEQRDARRMGAMTVAGALVLCCGALTFRQTLIYHDEETLWRDTVARNPKAWMAWGNLGGLLVRMAAAPGADSSAPAVAAELRRAGSAALLDEAGRCCDKAVTLQPQEPEAYADRALLRLACGQGVAAMQDYDKAIELNPSPEAYYNRAEAAARLGRLQQAVDDYSQAIRLRPAYAQAYGNRALAFVQLAAAQTDRAQEELRHRAFEDFDKALAVQPDYALAYFNRGNTWLFEMRRPGEAIGDYTHAIAINPGYSAAYLNRALAYYTMKDYPRALSDVRAAERLGARPKPDFLRLLSEAAGRSGSPLSPTP